MIFGVLRWNDQEKFSRAECMYLEMGGPFGFYIYLLMKKSYNERMDLLDLRNDPNVLMSTGGLHMLIGHQTTLWQAKVRKLALREEQRLIELSFGHKVVHYLELEANEE